MQFRDFLESEPFVVRISKLYGNQPKMDEVYHDIINKKLSHSSGQPIIVSKLSKPRGSFFIIDGYHRVVEAALVGETVIRAVIDNYIPAIDKAGVDGFKYMLSEKAPISELIKRFKT